MAAITHRTILLGMYRSILNLHKNKLPPDMREIGDAYVKEEFKAMKKAKKEEHIRAFVGSWQKYIDTISSQKDRFGQSLTKSTIKKMDVEQQAQLQKLKDAAAAVAMDAEDAAMKKTL